MAIIELGLCHDAGSSCGGIKLLRKTSSTRLLDRGIKGMPLYYSQRSISRLALSTMKVTFLAGKAMRKKKNVNTVNRHDDANTMQTLYGYNTHRHAHRHADLTLVRTLSY